jgi:hypothetical protein
MSAAFAGRLAAHLGLNTAGFSRGVQQAQGQARGMAGTFAALRTRLVPVAAALTAVAAAAASIIVPAMRGAREIDELTKAARRVDGSFAGWSASRLAAEEAGVAVETLADQVQNLNARLARPNAATTDALRQLGLSADELRRMDVDQRLGAIADRVQALGLDAGQTTAILRGLGIENRQMANLIAAGGAAIAAARADIEDYGLAVSAIDTARIEQANDRIGRLSLITRYLGQQLATAVVPWLGRFSQAMTESLRTGGLLRGILDLISGAVRVVANTIGSVMTIATSFVQWLAEVSAAGIRGSSVLSNFVSTLWAVGDALLTPIRFVYQMVTGFADLIRGAGGFGEAMRLLGEVAVGVWEGIAGSAAALPAALSATWSRISAGFLRMVSNLQAQWGEFLSSIAEGISGTILDVGGLADSLGNAAERAYRAGQRTGILASDAAHASATATAEAQAIVEAAFERSRRAMEALREAVARGGEGSAAAVEAQRELNAALAATESAGGAAARGIQAAADAGRDMQAQMRSGADALMGLIPAAAEGSRGALRYILQLLQQIAMAQLRLHLLQSMSGRSGGGLLGLLGRLLNPTIPALANGTRSFMGGMAAINERGGELAIMPAGSTVIPHDLSKRMVDGGMGQAVIRLDLSPEIEARIMSRTEGMVIQTARAQQAALPAAIRQFQSNPRRG